MSVSFWQDKSAGNDVNSDIVIIGGGIAGLSAAFWINKMDPSISLSIVEKYQLGSGATGRNAGFITCGSVEHFNRLVEKHGDKEAGEIWKFSEENLDLLKEHIIQNDELDLLFEKKGSFSLASTTNEFEELKKSSQLMSKFGIDVDVLDAQEIISRLGASDFVGGIKYLNDASIHPIKMLNKIRTILESKDNIKFYENNEVYAIDTYGEGKQVKTNQHKFNCSLVVMATNGYSSLLEKYFADKIFPTRGQILMTEPVNRFMEGPCYANFVLDYFRQLPTGEVVIGGFRQLQKDVEVGYSDQVSDVIQSALEEFLQKHVPAVRGKKITHRWSGIMGFSVDGQPMVGALPSDPQIFFTGGFTAHGLGLAFNCGKELAKGIFGEQIKPFISARRLQ